MKLVLPAFVCGVIAIGAMLHWLWELDAEPRPPVDIGGGLRLPVYATGPTSHSWWAVWILILVAASVYGCGLASYGYLWTVSPDVWPAVDDLPAAPYPLVAAVLLVLSSGAIALADRALGANVVGLAVAGLAAALTFLAAAFGIDLVAHHASGLAPTESSYGAIVYMLAALQGFFVAVLALMALFTAARGWAGRLTAVRRVVFDNTKLLWHYTVGQSLVGLALVHVFPRLAG